MTVTHPTPGGYETRAGWCFHRGDGGTVTIWAPDIGEELTVESTVWAAIVAAVSSTGETRPAYRHALAFHLGDLP